MEIVEILLWIITIVIAIAGILFSLKAITKMNPVFTKANYNIIVSNYQSFPDLNITYRGDLIQNLSSTNIIFWNGGNKRIEKNDIAEKAPLQIIAKEGVKIFSVSIIRRTKLENAFSVYLNKDQTTIDLIFDYLSKGDGVEIQIIHSGNSDKDIDFRGTIKDVGSPIDLTLKLVKFRKDLESYSLIVGTFIGFIFTIIIAIYASDQIKTIESNLKFALFIVGFILSILFGVIIAIPLIKYVYRLFFPYLPNFK